MNLSNSLNARPLQPLKYYFKEFVPLCGKNGLQNTKPIGGSAACVEELQTLFACLKKWEYDDLPCAKFNQDFMRCIAASKVEKEKMKAAYKDSPIGTGEEEKTLTVGQYNKLMKRYPQPDLGKSPYRAMHRLPTQSYADDIFHRKNTKGKAS